MSSKEKLNSSGSNKTLNIIKNPFLLVAFFLVLFFFIPLPDEYNLIKAVIALIVIVYGISLGAFKKKASNSGDEITGKKLEEVEKSLEEMQK